jgi:hypothetical protein
MTVKLALLKSGENIISDIQEMVVDERVIGFFFNKPHVVLIKDFESVSKNNEEKIKHSFDINLFPWILLSTDKRILVPNDWVVTLVEPVEKLKQMYEQKVLNNVIEEKNETNEDTITDEQSDSNQSD